MHAEMGIDETLFDRVINDYAVSLPVVSRVIAAIKCTTGRRLHDVRAFLLALSPSSGFIQHSRHDRPGARGVSRKSSPPPSKAGARS